MKEFKKAIALLLTVIMVIMSLGQAVFAFDADGEEIFTVAPPKAYLAFEAEGEISTDIDWDGIKAVIREGVAERKENIDISSFGLKKSEANIDYLADYVYLEPSLLGSVTRFSYSSSSSTSVVRTIIPTYSFDKAEYEKRFVACEDRIDKIIADLKDNDEITDLERVLLVHDRIATFCSYDYDNLKAGTVPAESYTAYGTLGLGVSVCQGYALSFDWILTKLGIESYYTVSNALNHAWNRVVLDGEQYHIDITFDDPVYDVTGRVEHDDCIVSTAELHETHVADDYSAVPTDTRYDDAYWVNSRAEIQLIDNTLYFISYDKSEICRVNSDGSIDVLYSLKNYSREYGYVGCIIRLESCGSKLIFNTKNSINTYDVYTGEEKAIYTPDLSQYPGCGIYGMYMTDGVVYMDITDSVNYTSNSKDNRLSFVYQCEEHRAFTQKVIKEATCNEKGVTEYTCKDCGYSYTAETGTGSHSFALTSTVSATCTQAGYSVYTCGVCGITENRDFTSAAEHSYEWVTDKAATCSAEGVKHEKCKNCTAVRNENTAIEKTAHTPQTVAAVEATCVKKGLTEGTKCSVCGEVLVAQTETEFAAHKYNTQITEATCTQDGAATSVCSVCGDTQVKVLYATNHEGKYGTKGLSPTCTEDGFSGGIYCPDCKTYLSGHEVLKATGHTPYVSLEEIEATCTKSGRTQEVRCAGCDKVLEASKTTAKTPHIDADDNGFCDECNTELNPIAHCSCNCHKTGFMGFIWKITNFFNKLFKSNPVCACGVKHY